MFHYIEKSRIIGTEYNDQHGSYLDVCKYDKYIFLDDIKDFFKDFQRDPEGTVVLFLLELEKLENK